MSRRRKPQRPQPKKKGESQERDRCQTPWYAVNLILPWLPKDAIIWESAAGEGQIVSKLTHEGYEVIATDILTGHNYFRWQPDEWDIQVTNCPFSIKYEWLHRAYQLDKPFALLMPSETYWNKTATQTFKMFGEPEIIAPEERINYKMPNAGYSGNGANFHSSWFTWGLNIGQPVTRVPIAEYPDGQPMLFTMPVQPTARQTQIDLAAVAERKWHENSIYRETI